MSRVSIRVRAALLLLAVLVLVTVVFSALRQLGQTSTTLATSGTRIQAFANANHDFDKAMLDQESSLRGFALTGNDVYLQTYDRGQTVAAAAQLTLHNFARTESQGLLRAEDAAALAWQSWATTRIVTVRSAGAGGTAADIEGTRLFDAYRAAVSTLDTFDLGQSAAAAAETADVQAQQQLVRGAGWIAVTVALVALGVLIFASILRPLERQARFLAVLETDQGARVPGLRRRDEIGRLAKALAALQQSLQDRRSLTQATIDVSGRAELDEVLERGLAQIAQLLDADEAVCTVFTDGVRRVAGSHRGLFHPGELVSQRTPGDDALAGQITVISSASEMGPGLMRDRIREHGYESLIVVPMLSGGDAVGTAACMRLAGSAPFDATDAARAEMVVPFIAAGVKVATLVSELRSANEVKSRFLANMSHELRTPLNAILGFSQVLEAGDFGPLNERQQRYVGHIENSGRRLLDLINDILDLAKVEAGLMEVRVDTIELAPVLLESRSEIERMAEAKGLQLTHELEHGIWVRAEARRLQQVVLNLLSNAVKFTPEGGTITVRSARVGEDRAEVSVQDSGVGIAPEDQERVFDEFAQVADGTQGHQGTGLGLSLSRRLTELMGGTLTLQSKPGEGSRFTISLVAEGGSGPAPEGELVLVVEDEAPNREYVSMLLEEGGYRTVSVADTANAIRVLKRDTPAAMVLDILLPDVDGWTLVADLRQDPATSGIPIVVVTATDTPSAERLGSVAAFLTKPVTGQELLEAVARAIRPPGSRRRGE